MEEEAFVETVKVGFGVMFLGFLRMIFTRFIRTLFILGKRRKRATHKPSMNSNTKNPREDRLTMPQSQTTE